MITIATPGVFLSSSEANSIARDLFDAAMFYAENGRKIAAIKSYRYSMHVQGLPCDLRAAKMWLDDYIDNMPQI